ncbi:MAG: NUDIX domain-containing protein [Candidatus Dojkabacteria bacterium]
MEKASLEKKSQELLDVVDEEGRVIGHATREMCHSNPELLHPTVHFTLVDLKNRAVLLSVRNRDQEYDGGMVTFFGEHMFSGESPNLAIIRGVEEELGFRPRGFLSLGTKIFRYGDQRELGTFYLVTYSGEELNFDVDEIESLEWVLLETVKEYDDNLGEITKYWIDRFDWEKLSY